MPYRIFTVFQQHIVTQCIVAGKWSSLIFPRTRTASRALAPVASRAVYSGNALFPDREAFCVIACWNHLTTLSLWDDFISNRCCLHLSIRFTTQMGFQVGIWCQRQQKVNDLKRQCTAQDFAIIQKNKRVLSFLIYWHQVNAVQKLTT